jgi:hypothetical protein
MSKSQTYKALHISCAPIWPANSGYKQSVLGRIWESVLAGHDLHVLVLNNESSIAKGSQELPIAIAAIRYQEVKNLTVRNPLVELLNLFTTEPRFARIFSTHEFRHAVDVAVEATNPEEIIAESIWALSAIQPNEWHRVHLVIHDVTYQLLLSSMMGERSLIRKLFHWRDLQRCEAFETSILQNFPGRITFLTEEDRDYYQGRFNITADRCLLASNKLMMGKLERRVQHSSPFLLFPGSVEFHQNFTAVKWMAEEVWPLLDKRFRDLFTVAVTGRVSQSNRRKLQALGMPIKWTGEIPYEQLNELYRSCVCVVSPIISGTGIKVKNLEAVTKGIPLVTTHLSSRGIDSPLLYCAVDDSANAFVQMLETCVVLELGSTR